MFEKVLNSPMGYSIKVSKPNEESRLTEWGYHCPVAPYAFWKSVKEYIQDIMPYRQQVAMSHEYYIEYIKLLWEAVTKHFL